MEIHQAISFDEGDDWHVMVGRHKHLYDEVQFIGFVDLWCVFILLIIYLFIYFCWHFISWLLIQPDFFISLGVPGILSIPST